VDTGGDAVQDVTVAEAAARLGISKEAVRKRIARGTLKAGKDADGTVKVRVPYASAPPFGTPSGTPSDAAERIEDLRDNVRHLREQLDAERQAHAEARRIIAGLVERIPALEQPSDPTGASETPPEADHRGTGSVDAEEDRQRPWWRRWLGG
jgi:excisionase family DNA binding protein